MFGKLWHREQQRTRQVLASVAQALSKYNRKDLDAEEATLHALDSAIALSEQDVRLVSRLESLKAEVVTAQLGVNPYTLEKHAVGRRQMRNIVAYRVLQGMQTLFAQEDAAIEAKLREAEATIAQILLSALQSGLLTQSALDATEPPVIWKAVEADHNLFVAKKKVLLAVGTYDALILCDQVIAGLRSPQ